MATKTRLGLEFIHPAAMFLVEVIDPAAMFVYI